MERRRSPRSLARGQRLWLALPHERWALLHDVSHDGMRILAGPLPVGSLLEVRRELGGRLAEARIAEVVYCDGHRAGLRLRLDHPTGLSAPFERRASMRTSTRGLTAWIIGRVRTPAVVHDVSATGARVEPLLPLHPHQQVRAELIFGDTLICERRARVVRCRGGEVGLQFTDGKRVAA